MYAADNETLFACRNLSLNGMAVRINDADVAEEDTVVMIRLPSLNLHGAAWVIWRERIDDSAAALGLKFLRLGPIPDTRLPIVPRPYEAYEVREFIASQDVAAIYPILAG